MSLVLFNSADCMLAYQVDYADKIWVVYKNYIDLVSGINNRKKSNYQKMNNCLLNVKVSIIVNKWNKTVQHIAVNLNLYNCLMLQK